MNLNKVWFESGLIYHANLDSNLMSFMDKVIYFFDQPALMFMDIEYDIYI